MDPTRPDRPGARDDRRQGDPSVQHRWRTFLRSTLVIWGTVIVLTVVFVLAIVAFAAS